jgi:hypothetical protein
MKPDFDPRRLDALTHLLLDGDLPPESVVELREILRGSAEARRRYRRTTAVHCALVRHGHDRLETPELAPAPARETAGRSARRGIRWLAAGLAAAACIVLAAKLALPPGAAAPPPLAVLSGTTSAVWEGAAITTGHPFERGRSVKLVRGFAEVSFASGVQVILEGPCRFEINGADTMGVTHGRASVMVPPDVARFHLDTPGGRITDLGTEFGVAVGSSSEGAVVLTEVFDGEIEIPAVNDSRHRLQSGDALAIIRDTTGTRLVATLDDYRVDLADSARRLPAEAHRVSSGVNLALGKPVFSPAYYFREFGSRFPPETLTDGRLNDSGSPGDWSFWLAPNGEPGEFTVDLLAVAEIGRIELQNTRNRTHGDRGLREFAVLVSIDNQNFREILRGELAAIDHLPPPGEDFPVESFRFEPVEARYVKLVGLSHYRHPDRPATDENHGGGLNEILIYAP